MNTVFEFSADLWHMIADISLGQLLNYMLCYVFPWVIQPTGELQDLVHVEESKNNRKTHHATPVSQV